MNGEKRPPYAYMIQEALLSEGGRSLSKTFISEYILSNYPCLIHDDDHTTLLNQTLQDLTQRKNLSVVINVEDQSGHHYILLNEIYYENTGAERPTTAPHLRPSNYPRVVAQHQQGRKEGIDEEEKGVVLQKVLKNVLDEEVVAQHPQGRKEGENGIQMKKRTSKSRSVREIMRIDDVVQKVLKNVLEVRVAAVVKAVVGRGIERQRIVIKRIEGMVLEVSESIVEIAEAAEAEAAEAEAAADHDKVALENTEDHQNDDD